MVNVVQLEVCTPSAADYSFHNTPINLMRNHSVVCNVISLVTTVNFSLSELLFAAVFYCAGSRNWFEKGRAVDGVQKH